MKESMYVVDIYSVGLNGAGSLRTKDLVVFTTLVVHIVQLTNSDIGISGRAFIFNLL